MEKIYKKTDLPKREKDQDFSVDVIVCDQFGLLNIAFYNYEHKAWEFHCETAVSYEKQIKEIEFVWMYKPPWFAIN